MMKKLLTLALLLLSMASASAQYLVFHVGGGLASHYGGSTRNIGAFKVGAGFEVELSQTLSIEPSLLYYAKGWKDHDLTVPLLDDEGHQLYDDNGNARYGKMNVTTNTNYIVLPVLLNYYLPLGRPHYIVFSAGPYAAYGVGGKQKTKGDTSRSGAERYSYEVDAFDVAGSIVSLMQVSRRISDSSMSITREAKTSPWCSIWLIASAYSQSSAKPCDPYTAPPADGAVYFFKILRVKSFCLSRKSYLCNIKVNQNKV